MSLFKQTCVVCLIEKQIDCFEWAKNRPNPRTTCKICRYKNRDVRKENENSKKRKKEWFEANKEIIKDKAELRLYGITKKQLGQISCQICGGKQRLSIDHDHKTGLVRGLLCSPCNAGLGFFKDNIKTMENAIKYLNLHNDGPHYELV